MRCVVCRKNKWKKYWGKLVRCQNCDFVRAGDKYFRAEHKNFYTQDYFNGLDYRDYRLERQALLKNFTDRIARIRKIKKSGKLLEIGCAYGYFLLAAEKYFDCTGVDLDKNVTDLAAVNAREARILTGDIQTLRLAKKTFDVVCMFDTIEHLRNPEKVVSCVFPLLKPGGIIVVETGDIGSRLAQFQKNKWRLVTPPLHLQYFSKKTLVQFLKREGFETLACNYVSFYRTVGQMVFRMTKNPILALLFRPISRIVFPLQTYDLLFVVARKPNLG